MDAYIDRLRQAGLEAALTEVTRLQVCLSQAEKRAARKTRQELYNTAYNAWVAAGRPTFTFN